MKFCGETTELHFHGNVQGVHSHSLIQLTVQTLES